MEEGKAEYESIWRLGCFNYITNFCYITPAQFWDFSKPLGIAWIEFQFMAFKGLASSHKGALPISDTYESCVFPWSMIREPLGYLFVIPQYTVLCHVL